MPFHWKAEFANGLLMMVRRNRAAPPLLKEAFEQITQLPLTIDQSGQDFVETSAAQLALNHGLTIYDAIYVETALRLGLPLATLDKRLAVAARIAGAELSGNHLS